MNCCEENVACGRGEKIFTLWVICYPNQRFGQISLDYGFASARNDILEALADDKVNQLIIVERFGDFRYL